MAQQHDNLAATIIRIAAVIAAIVALCLPAGYYGLSHQYQTGAMRSEADFNAILATQYVALNPDMWHFQQIRLQEMLDRGATETELPEQRRILDEKNTVIAAGAASLRPRSPYFFRPGCGAVPASRFRLHRCPAYLAGEHAGSATCPD